VGYFLSGQNPIRMLFWTCGVTPIDSFSGFSSTIFNEPSTTERPPKQTTSEAQPSLLLGYALAYQVD
jgi:hypothetical protein